MADKITVGAFVTAIIALLLAGGGELQDQMTVQDAVGELDNYYICDVIGIESLDEYARLSGTEYTAYPYSDSNVGRKYCKTDEGVKGKWFSLKGYADSLGLDPYQLLDESTVVLEPTPTPVDPIPVEPSAYEGTAKKVKCGQGGCYST